jgi:hypothetical protein
MRPVLVVVADVFIHETHQMSFIQNDCMVEQIPTAVANPALCDAVLPWTSEGSPLGV